MPHPRIRRYLRHGTLPQLAVFEASARLASFTGAGRRAPSRAAHGLGADPQALARPSARRCSSRSGGRSTSPRPAAACRRAARTLFGVLDDLEGDSAPSARARRRPPVARGLRCRRAFPRAPAGAVRRAPSRGRRDAHDRQSRRARPAHRVRRRRPHAVRADRPRTRRWSARRFSANPLVVMAPPSSDPLAQARRIAFSRVARRTFVMREPGSATRAADGAGVRARAGCAPRVRMTLSSHHAVREAVRAGHGLALLPAHAFGPDDERAGLAALDVDGLPAARRLAVRVSGGGRAVSHGAGLPRPRASESARLADAAASPVERPCRPAIPVAA